MGRRGNLGGVRQDKVEAIILSASLYSGDFTTARAGGHTHSHQSVEVTAQQKRRLYCPNSSLARLFLLIIHHVLLVLFHQPLSPIIKNNTSRKTSSAAACGERAAHTHSFAFESLKFPPPQSAR
jgi:hypothetical protein